MAAEVAFPSKNKALLFAVKNLQNTSAYQDQWIADIDLAAAIRHEYGLWDPQFDAAVSYKNVTKAINSDPQLKLALDPNAFKTNKTKMFRRRYKPKTAATIKVTDVEAYTITKDKKKATREMYWYYFDSNTKPLPKKEDGMCGMWYEQSYLVETGCLLVMDTDTRELSDLRVLGQ